MYTPHYTIVINWDIYVPWIDKGLKISGKATIGEGPLLESGVYIAQDYKNTSDYQVLDSFRRTN